MPGSTVGIRTGYKDIFVVLLTPPGKCHLNTWKWAKALFPILLHSPFILLLKYPSAFQKL
jgi:hypothetical protein